LPCTRASRSIYGGLTNDAFVDAIYLNVAGKPADVAGKAYWVGRLNTDLSRSGFVAEFLYYVLELTEADLQDMYNRGQITGAELQTRWHERRGGEQDTRGNRLC